MGERQEKSCDAEYAMSRMRMFYIDDTRSRICNAILSEGKTLNSYKPWHYTLEHGRASREMEKCRSSGPPGEVYHRRKGTKRLYKH